jgi:hypothetical protein
VLHRQPGECLQLEISLVLKPFFPPLEKAAAELGTGNPGFFELGLAWPTWTSADCKVSVAHNDHGAMSAPIKLGSVRSCSK